ncbi:hypothetical protein SEA_REYNAULD_49 [Rhodococcus phage Reynauld]|uniref:Uncharacterized protein n=1 Tax=Rhodococcus phage Reynauld TaxID=3062845 RepID=A0ACD4ULH8_9CAUD|nr:hypothetical protein SEA_REYNAULD_49 [Rhodococcus phage Reynauld]
MDDDQPRELQPFRFIGPEGDAADLDFRPQRIDDDPKESSAPEYAEASTSATVHAVSGQQEGSASSPSSSEDSPSQSDPASETPAPAEKVDSPNLVPVPPMTPPPNLIPTTPVVQHAENSTDQRQLPF